MRSRRLALTGMALAGAMLLIAVGSAAALRLDSGDGPIPPPTPSVPDPTERDSRMKEADAARPTPTAVPSVLTCPATEEVCDFGLELVDALGTGGASILAVASPVPIQCPADGSVVALQPGCSEGGSKSGYFTGIVAKAWGFVAAPELATFVASTLDARSRPRLVAIGCPYVDGSMNCGPFVAYTFSGDVEGQTLVVLTLQNESGARQMIGARRWAFDSREVRGGSTPFGQPGLPYQGELYFQPVTLP